MMSALWPDWIGGAERDRTADLLVANEALSQLSYSPTPQQTLRRAASFRTVSLCSLAGDGCALQTLFKALPRIDELIAQDLRIILRTHRIYQKRPGSNTVTLQEQQMIDELVDRIRNTQLAEKDSAAEQRLQQGLSGYPDAVYVLAQTVLVQKYGLEQARQQLQSMQAELDQLRQQPPPAPAKSGGSFLGNLFGGSHEQPQPQAAQPSGYANQVSYQPVNNPGYPPYAEPAYPPYPPQGYPPQGGYPPQAYPQSPGYGYGQPVGYGAPMGGGGGGFLRGAMQTAAGVAAGEMVFQGMESLFHGFGEGHEERGFSEGRPTEIVNNYYGEGEGGEHHHESAADRDDGSFYNPKNDASRDDDRGHDSGAAKFADTDNDDDSNAQDDSTDTGDDNFSNDDSDYDSGDDGSSGDDSSY
jgi:uncharacterized protein